MANLAKLVSSIIVCELVGIIGAAFTIGAIPNWYANLNRPFFAPPNSVFGPVWTILYMLMGVSFYLIWKQGWKKKVSSIAAIFFLSQLALNFLWSPIFFGLKSPLLGLITIVALWILIIITMRKFYVLSKAAFYLLIPYFLWVSFATLLNAAIFILN